MDEQTRVVHSDSRVVSKPAGGFRPMGVPQICMVWWAYRTGVLKYFDFRVYLALHEVDERRQAARRVRARRGVRATPGVLPRIEVISELTRLVGSSSVRTVRSALSRLESVGLVTLNEFGLVFAGSPQVLRLERLGSFADVLNGIDQRINRTRRRIPVPRRILRYLAREATSTLAATVFGHLFCSLRWTPAECRIGGPCTARVISELFGVDIRSVRRARSRLRDLGWLVSNSEHDDAGTLQPNLEWAPRTPVDSAVAVPSVGINLSLSPDESCTVLSPPAISLQLRSGSGYPQPAAQRRPGVFDRIPYPSSRKLFHVLPDDLKDPSRLCRLFEQAITTGLVKRTESDRLRFFAAAERAKRVATRNPCGFFAAIVRGGRWRVLSHVDEDRALATLKKLDSLAESAANNGILVSPPANVGSAFNRSRDSVRRVDRLIAEVAARCAITPIAGIGGNSVGHSSARMKSPLGCMGTPALSRLAAEPVVAT